MAKYTACLKKNGVTLPSGAAGGPPGAGGGPGGAPPTGTSTTQRPARPAGGNATFAKAQTACASLRPAGLRAGGFGGPGGAGGANSAAFAAYRNCLTLHGVKASAVAGPNAAAPTAKTKKALAACSSLRPTPQAPTTTTPAGGNS
jgi:hypothetical protein